MSAYHDFEADYNSLQGPACNFRDLAEHNGGVNVQPGSAQLQNMGIQCLLDLRDRPQSCKAAKLPTAARVQPWPCPSCSGVVFSVPPGTGHHVYHACLLTGSNKLRIFEKTSMHIKVYALLSPLCLRTPKKVMKSRVADPDALGLVTLYHILLKHSQPEIAQALRVFARPENFPVMMHCVQGKDRTGLIAMLLLQLTGASMQAIERDYAQSHLNLLEAQQQQKQGLEVDPTLFDPNIEAQADVIRLTVEYINEQRGGISRYCQDIGLSSSEVAAIRANLSPISSPSAGPGTPDH